MSNEGSVPIPVRVDRGAVREFERRLFASPDATLLWEEPTTYRHALDRTALLHALVTWSRLAKQPTLQIGAQVVSLGQLADAMTSDELVVAVALASTVLRADATTATPHARAAMRSELARRRSIPSGLGHRTLLVTTLEDELAFSPDVMTATAGGGSTDYRTRTMFHRVDLEPLPLNERSALVGTREKIEKGVGFREWLVRDSWPKGHPLEGLEEVSTLGQRVLQPTPAMMAEWEGRHPAGTSPSDWLGKALWEIFQNTEHHALVSNGAPIPRALRALTASPLRASDFDGAPKSPLADFIRSHHRDAFVAISVVDSGDGLAYTAAARDRRTSLEEDEEIDYLKRAVRGEARSAERPLHGFGMTEVAHLLTAMGGFLQIRSGSLVVSRDFVEHEFTEGGGDDSPTYWRWDHDDQTRPHRRWGSAVTIVIPHYGSPIS